MESSSIVHKSNHSTKVEGIYRVLKDVKTKDEELPFTNVNFRASRLTYDLSTI